jgi:hypothetical protein
VTEEFVCLKYLNCLHSLCLQTNLLLSNTGGTVGLKMNILTCRPIYICHDLTAWIGLCFFVLGVSRLYPIRHVTLVRTSLDESRTRCRELYLTSHNTHKRLTFIPPAGFKPAVPTNSRATGISHLFFPFRNFQFQNILLLRRNYSSCWYYICNENCQIVSLSTAVIRSQERELKCRGKKFVSDECRNVRYLIWNRKLLSTDGV